MLNPEELEESFHEFSNDLSKWAPDGIIPIDLAFLSEVGLLTQINTQENEDPELPFSFNVIETAEKVTLHNEHFAVWIMPKFNEGKPQTLTFLSRINENKPHLEIVFSTAGVYNTPKFLIKVLQHFIEEIIDTEAMITSFDNDEV